MGFGGSVSAMLASLRHNKRERVSRFEKPNTYRSKNNISLKFKKLSEKELVKAKAEIKRKSENHKRKLLDKEAEDCWRVRPCSKRSRS